MAEEITSTSHRVSDKSTAERVEVIELGKETIRASAVKHVAVTAPRVLDEPQRKSFSDPTTTSRLFERDHLERPFEGVSLPPFRRPTPFAQFLDAAGTPVERCPSGVTLYGPPGLTPTSRHPERPIRVAILTSIRDVGVEEGVGRCWEPGNTNTYLKGTIETALEAVNDERLGGFVEVAAIITDDLPKDLRRSGYVASPEQVGEWIFPRDLRNASGELATSLTTNIPSTFRSLPRWDIPGRLEEKSGFESKIVGIMAEAGAEVLVSDHFLARIQFLVDPDFHGLLGRVLNTHPGITRADHPYPCRGKSPDEMAHRHLRGERLMPNGEVVTVPPYFRAGASFHFVTAEIDAGPVICDGELTELHPGDTSQDIGRRIYATSKEPVFIAGLRHYASNIFPEVARTVPEPGDGAP